MQAIYFTIQANEALNDQNHLIKVAPADNRPLPDMVPGQFVQIQVDNSPQVFLRRPISINFVDHERNERSVLVQQIREGTRKICEAIPGDAMNLIYPFGNSLTIPEHQGPCLLIG